MDLVDNINLHPRDGLRWISQHHFDRHLDAILNCQTFKALPRCSTSKLTSLLGRYYAGNALNV